MIESKQPVCSDNAQRNFKEEVMRIPRRERATIVAV